MIGFVVDHGVGIDLVVHDGQRCSGRQFMFYQMIIVPVPPLTPPRVVIVAEEMQLWRKAL